MHQKPSEGNNHLKRNITSATEMAASFDNDVIDSKEFQRELMSNVSEENAPTSSLDMCNETGSCLRPCVETTSCPTENNDVIDSKDFQKELMSKVRPLSVDSVATIWSSKGEGNTTTTATTTTTTTSDCKSFQELTSQVTSSSELEATHTNDKQEKKRKSNLLPLDAFFSPFDDDPIMSKKMRITDEESSQISSEISEVSNIKVEEEGSITESERNNAEPEEGEITVEELEEGELRELEEGELPEDVETVDASRHTSVIKKTLPMDYEGFNRKRKVALLIAYCGAGFHGMQKNPEVETIELRLMEALSAIKAIRPDLKNEYLLNNNNQISFNRAARTDKGVSAARQVVSLKLIANENFLEDVNKNLPPEIRVFGMERVTKSFDAKCSCYGRSYEYLVPTVAFAPSKEIMDSTYRLTDEQFEKVSSILKKFIGTHNFHNFTSGKRFTDKSAIRYITDFKGSKPFECRGHEFISLEVTGQSFLIHQIRKMIGLCMAICRGYCGEDTVEKSWMEAKLDIPKAPGLGLLLNRVDYKSYNQKVEGYGTHNPLTWENSELEIERYKIERLWHSIIEEEIKKSSLVHWLKTLNNHTYTEAGMNAPMNSDYKGKKGVFPVLKRKNDTYDTR